MRKLLAHGGLLLISVLCCTSLYAQTSASTKVSSTTQTVAKEGDKVWVIINHVKADKRQQFEKFVHEVFWPNASKLSQADQRLFKQTRVLHPANAEEDGTYSYLFIMDPLIEGGDYDIGSLLRKMFGEAKAEEYGKMFGETQARDQTQYMSVQAKYY
jgi:hypothetical protein